MAIPNQQTGAWVEKPGPDTHITFRNDLPVPVPDEGQVPVKVEWMNHWKIAAIGEAKAVVEVYNVSELDDVLQRLQKNEISGRAVANLRV